MESSDSLTGEIANPTPAEAPSAPAAPAAPAPQPAAPKPPRSLEDAIGDRLTALDAATKAREKEGASPAPGAPAPDPKAAERPRDDRGRFLKADGEDEDGDEEPEVPAEVEQPAEEGEPDEEPEPEEPAFREAVAVPGRREEDEPVEIEVDSPEKAERLRQLVNDGMRRSEFHRQMADVQKYQRERREFEHQLQNAPETLLVNGLREDVQIPVARALVAKHLDKLLPDIERFVSDEMQRQLELKDFEIRSGREQQAAAQAAQEYDQAVRVLGELNALIPDGTDDETAREFLHIGTLYLRDLAQQNPAQVTPDAVKQIMANHVRRYFGDSEGAPTRSATSKPPGAPTKEAALAEKTHATVQRLQAAQKARSIAARVAPAGAGARPIQRKQPPKGQTIEQRIAWIEQNGGLENALPR